MRRFYETTILSKDGTHGLHFYVVPEEFLSKEAKTINGLSRLMGLTEETTVRPAYLVHALNALATVAYAEEPSPPTTPDSRLRAAYNAPPCQEYLSLAEQAAFMSILPWEASPLGGRSLSEFLTRGLELVEQGAGMIGAAGVGAKLGMMLVAAGSPVGVLVAAGAGGAVIGIAVVEATKPVAKEIGLALAAKVRQVIGFTPRPDEAQPPGAQPMAPDSPTGGGAVS